jgi:hypothetical protein
MDRRREFDGSGLAPQPKALGDQQTFFGDRSLAVAKAHVRKNLEAGTECPCCGQYCKLYRRKLNSDMARFLIALHIKGRMYPADGWVDIKEIQVRGGDYGKLVHWELVELQPGHGPKKKTSGMWRLTAKGDEFVRNRIDVPSHVLLYNNQIEGWSPERTTIMDALGEAFDYWELMDA